VLLLLVVVLLVPPAAGLKGAMLPDRPLLLLPLLAFVFPRPDSGRGLFLAATASLLLLLPVFGPPAGFLLVLPVVPKLPPGTCNCDLPPAGACCAPFMMLAAVSGEPSTGGEEVGCLTSPAGP
jgi:hypothetical protein